MRRKIISTLFGAFLLLTSSLGVSAQAVEESFVIAGIVDRYQLNSVTTQNPGYIFTATFTYDPTTLLDLDASSENVSLFNNTNLNIEYIVYDTATNTEVISGVEVGNAVSRALIQNGANGTADFIRWTSTSRYNVDPFPTPDGYIHTGFVNFVDFSEPMDMVVASDLDLYPSPPLLEETDLARFRMRVVVPVKPNLRDSFRIDGTVTYISNSDPLAECAQDAKNHGQYTSCVAHVTNELKTAGEITGKEKGQLQSQSAKNR